MIFLLNLVRKAAWKICGLQYLQNQLDTQRYFINSYWNIEKFPKPTGNLALLHKADYLLLMVFHEVCKKEDLTYWLDYGTLLGAIRHNGFIPWDDDLDVSMPRDDYERAKEIFPSIFRQWGIETSLCHGRARDRMGIGYCHEKTGTWLDIFPCDSVPTRQIKDAKRMRFARESPPIIKRLLSFGNHMFASPNKEGNFLYSHTYTRNSFYWLTSREDVFPLKLHRFGKFDFYFPNNYEVILSQLYGDYMCFPKTGVLHHEYGRGALCDWHIRYGIDMNDIVEELNQILEKIMISVQ